MTNMYRVKIGLSQGRHMSPVWIANANAPVLPGGAVEASTLPALYEQLEQARVAQETDSGIPTGHAYEYGFNIDALHEGDHWVVRLPREASDDDRERFVARVKREDDIDGAARNLVAAWLDVPADSVHLTVYRSGE